MSGPNFGDDFENGNVKGWTLRGSGSTSSTGDFVIGDPNGTVNDADATDPAQPEDAYQGSGCAFTAQNTEVGVDDIDGGVVYLESPTIDLSGFTHAELNFVRWYFQRDSGEGDYYVTEASHDDGDTWVRLETLSSKSNSWTARSFDLEDYIALTGTVRVRFGAADSDGSGNIVEAAIDNVEIWADNTVNPTCAPWPGDQGYYKDLFVDGGTQLTGNSNSAASGVLGLSYDTMLTSSISTQNSTIIGSSSDSNGVLLYPDGAPRFRMVYVNGGSAGGHGRDLGTEGRSRFQDFFFNGGSYTGSCAGAYIATSLLSSYFHLFPGRPTYDGSFSTTMTINFEDLAHPLVQKFMEWNGSRSATGVRFIGGPMFWPKQSYIDIGTQYLGVVDADNNNSQLEGSQFIVIWKKDVNSGRMVIQIGHPEYDYNMSQRYLMASQFWYALEGQATQPKLKGKLSNDQPLSVSGSNAVGDKQYHRYTIDVPAGMSRLEIELYGLEHDVDLFAHPSCPAHTNNAAFRSTNDGTDSEKIVVTNPAEGEWHISVRGFHDVRNGSDYTLNAMYQ
jgi:hypothetical protein